jgi:hypothetical protein
VRQVVCVESAAHGVTVPVQTDEVDCQKQPTCAPHAFCDVRLVQGVSVPVHGVADAE